MAAMATMPYGENWLVEATSEDVKAVIDAGENLWVEFEPSFVHLKRGRERLAVIISAFANTEGGLLIIGVDDRGIKPVVVGINAERELFILDATKQKLLLFPIIHSRTIEIEGRELLLISVQKSNSVVISRDGVYWRVSDEIVPMPAGAIAEALPELGSTIAPSSIQKEEKFGAPNIVTQSIDATPKTSASIEAVVFRGSSNPVAGALEQLTRSIKTYERKLERAQSWRSQWVGYVLSAVVGALVVKFLETSVGSIILVLVFLCVLAAFRSWSYHYDWQDDD